MKVLPEELFGFRRVSQGIVACRPKVCVLRMDTVAQGDRQTLTNDIPPADIAAAKNARVFTR